MSWDPFLSGERLYGDDLTMAEITAWFADEREAYASLGAAEHGSADTYGYNALNLRHGFRHLPNTRFEQALGLGSSYGGEFRPVLNRVGKVTILEPSSQLRSRGLDGVPVEYREPAPSGKMPFADGTFDLVLSLGTLHHIPNVTYLISEIGRVLTPGGWVLIREPVISLGDWRRPRPGLTPHERGIPLAVFRRAFATADLMIIRETACMFPTTGRVARLRWGFDTKKGVLLDQFLSFATMWNDRYHPTRKWHKARPTSRFFVLNRPHRGTRDPCKVPFG